MNSSVVLARLADEFSSAIPAVDAEAEHSRWQAGIGPFEEERQIEMITQAIEEDVLYSIETEEPYLNRRERCDLFVRTDSAEIPIEAKLIRFRYDNGNIDPNSFAKVFSPFPEHSSSSLLTDSQKLRESNFEHEGGLLGLYYEAIDEKYTQRSSR